jgi:hypothetical protein
MTDVDIYSQAISSEELEEFNQDIVTLNSKVEDFNSKMRSFVSSVNTIDIEHGLSYLDAKNVYLSAYMFELIGFSGDKTKGIFSEDRIKNLLGLKVTQEKMKSIDNKIKNQLDRLQRLAEGDITTDDLCKSRLIDAIDDEDGVELDSNNQDDEENLNKANKKKALLKKSKQEGDKYVPNKQYFDFNETDQEKNKRRKLLEKQRRKLPELYQDLMNEFSERPEEVADDYQRSHVGKYLKEVDDYEREHLTNIVVGKKKLKELRRKDKKEDDLGNFNSEMKVVGSILKYDEEIKKDKIKHEDAVHKMKNKLMREKRDQLKEAKRQQEEKKLSTKSNSTKFLSNKRQFKK